MAGMEASLPRAMASATKTAGPGSVRSSSSAGNEDARKKTTLEQALQGVLYSMVRGNASGALLAWIVMGADFFQLFVFAFDFDIPWNFPFLFSGRQTAGLLFGLYSWLVVFVACFLFVLGVYANVIYVARSFLRGHFKMIWPLKTLRTFITTLVTIGYIPILKAMVPPLNCEKGVLVEFPTFACSSAPMLVAITVIAYAALVPLCLLMAVVYFDQNPLSTNILARYTGRVDALFLFWKTILTLVFVLTHVTYLKPVLLMMCCGSIIFATLKILPYYHVGALRATIAMHAFFFVLAAFGTAISSFNPREGGSPYYTLAAIGVAIPAAAVAWVLAGRYAKAIKDRAERSIPELITLESSKVSLAAKAEPNAFASASHLPATSRAFYGLPVTAEVITRMRHIHERALAEYPNSPLVYMAMSQFLLQVTNDPGRALTYVRKAATMNPAWDVRFAIYCLERDIQQNIEAKNVGGQDSVDIVTYIQFQKSMAEATFYHRETLKHLIDFWGRLDKGESDYEHFPKVIHKIATAEARAEQSYKMLLKHFPNSRSLVLSYARFLEFGKNDRGAAAHFYDLAEQLENGGGREDRSMEYNSQSDRKDLSQSDRLDWTTGTQAGQEHNFRTILSKRRSPAAQSVRSALWKAFPLAFAFFCCFFGVMRSQLDGKTLQLSISDSIVSESYDISFGLMLSRRMQIYASLNMSTEFNATGVKLVGMADNMEASMRNVFSQLYGSAGNGNKVIDNYMVNSSVQIPYVTSAPWENVTIGTATIAFVDALEVTFARLRSMGLASMEFMNEPTLLVDPDFRGLLESRRQKLSVLDANDFIVNQLSGMAETFASWGVGIWSALALCGVLSMFIVSRLRIDPAMAQVEQERIRALDLFQEIPSNVIHEVHTKLKQAYATEGTREVNGKKRADEDRGEEADERRMLRRTKINFYVIVFLVAAIFATTTYYIVSSRFDATLYAELGHVKRTMAQLGFYAQELAVDSSNTIWSDQELRQHIIDLSADLQAQIYGLSTAQGSRQPYIQRFPAADALINGDGGLMELAQKYCTLAAQVATDNSPAYVLLRKDTFLSLLRMQEGSLRDAFDQVLATSAASANAGKTVAVDVSTALFIVVLLLFALLAFVNVRGVVRVLHEEGRRTYGMLMMIPPQVALEVPAIHDFITQAHRWTQETFRPEDAAAVVGITAEGVIMSCERTQALGFADDRELIGLMVTSLIPASLGATPKGKRVVAGLANKIKPFMVHKLTRVVTGAHGATYKFSIGVLPVEENRVRYKLLLYTPRDYAAEPAGFAAELTLAELDAEMRLKMTREVLMWSRDCMCLVDTAGVVRDANLSAARLFKREIRALIGTHVDTLIPAFASATSLGAAVREYTVAGPDTNPEVFAGKPVEIATGGQYGGDKVSLVVRSQGEKGYVFFLDHAAM